jgi:hypothetical protein
VTEFRELSGGSEPTWARADDGYVRGVRHDPGRLPF